MCRARLVLFVVLVVWPLSATAAQGAARRLVSESSIVTVACDPAAVVIGQRATCTVTIVGQGAGAASTPTGHVTLLTTGGGSFTGLPCQLAGTGAKASCDVDYTPAARRDGLHVITAKYGGDGHHSGGAGSTGLKVDFRATNTSVSCDAATVSVGDQTTCTAVVADGSPGDATRPRGKVTFSGNKNDQFRGSPCALAPSTTGPARSSCTITYSAVAAGARLHLLAARYQGQFTHAASGGRTTVIVTAPVPNLGGEYLTSGLDNPPSLSVTSCASSPTVLFSSYGRAYGMFGPVYTVHGKAVIARGAVVQLHADVDIDNVHVSMTMTDPTGSRFECDGQYATAVGLDGTVSYRAAISTVDGVRYDKGTADLRFATNPCNCGGLWVTFSSSAPPDRSLISYPGFGDTTGLSINGSAAQTGGTLTLTSGMAGQIGSIWSQTPVSPTRSFQAHYTVNSVATNGFAFVVQRDPAGTAALGSGGGELGFGGLAPSLAITFEPASQTIGVYENGTLIQTFDSLIYGDAQGAWFQVDYNVFTHELLIKDVLSYMALDYMPVPLDLESVMGGSEPVLMGFTAAAAPGATGATGLDNWSVSTPSG